MRVRLSVFKPLAASSKLSDWSISSPQNLELHEAIEKTRVYLPGPGYLSYRHELRPMAALVVMRGLGANKQPSDSQLLEFTTFVYYAQAQILPT